MNRRKIVIVGNCQARPLKQVIEFISDEVEVIGTPIVHLLKEENKVETFELFEKADLIVTQLIADNYPCKYIQTNHLKTLFSDKICTILNLFYSGYTPDWMYIRIPGKGTLKGPMGDYHNSTIVKAWLDKKTTLEASKLLFNVSYNKAEYNQIVKQSLSELSNREQNVDVPIVDFISNNLKNERLFFTFNHPSHFLIKEYARRILETVNINYSLDKLGVKQKEPLNQFIPALNPGVGFDFPIIEEFKGVEVDFSNDKLETKGTKLYLPEEIVKIFFRIYDDNDAFIRGKYGS
ncbi:WcbI family polysaccharide biosynthesis putative acetyltransferase [Aliiglaciecola aliphaticivorans]